MKSASLMQMLEAANEEFRKLEQEFSGRIDDFGEVANLVVPAFGRIKTETPANPPEQHCSCGEAHIRFKHYSRSLSLARSECDAYAEIKKLLKPNSFRGELCIRAQKGHMTSLSLRYAQLDAIPGHVLNFPRLRRLDLLCNKLRRLDSLEKLGELETFIPAFNPINYEDPVTKKTLEDLARRGVEVFDGHIYLSTQFFSEKNCDDVSLSKEYTIPKQEADAIDSLKPKSVNVKSHHVTYLGFPDSQLAQIPQEIFKLSRLEELDLSGCRITDAAGLVGLRHLKTVNLERNPVNKKTLEVLDACGVTVYR